MAAICDHVISLCDSVHRVVPGDLQLPLLLRPHGRRGCMCPLAVALFIVAGSKIAGCAGGRRGLSSQRVRQCWARELARGAKELWNSGRATAIVLAFWAPGAPRQGRVRGGPRPARARGAPRGLAPRTHAPAPTPPAGLCARHDHGGGFQVAGAGAGRRGLPRGRQLRARRAEAAAAGRAQGTQSAGPSATPAARARLGTPRDGAQRGGAIGLPVQRRNAETRVQPHFGDRAARRQNSCSSATRETTPANPGRPGQPIAMARSPAGRLAHRP